MYNAKVTRPTFEEENKKVTLTATVTSGSISKQKTFDVVVRKSGITDQQVVIKDMTDVKLPLSTSESFVALPIIGKFGSSISWYSENIDIITSQGDITKPARGEADETVTLTATFVKGEISESKDYIITICAWTAKEEIENAATLISWELIKGTNTDQGAVTENLVFPSAVGRNVNVEKWTTTNNEVCDSLGVITRPSYIQGPTNIDVACHLEHLGEELSVTIDDIWVKALGMSNKEVVNFVKAELNETSIKGNNKSLLEITESMQLPKFLSSALLREGKIAWAVTDIVGNAISSSSYIKLVSNTYDYACVINRPNSEDEDFKFKLVATITCDSESEDIAVEVKEFPAIILKKEESIVTPD